MYVFNGKLAMSKQKILANAHETRESL